MLLLFAFTFPLLKFTVHAFIGLFALVLDDQELEAAVALSACSRRRRTRAPGPAAAGEDARVPRPLPGLRPVAPSWKRGRGTS